MQEFKTCTRCCKKLPIEVFPTTKRNTSGLRINYENRCRPCKAEIAREWRKKNPGYSGTGEISSIPQTYKPWVSAIKQRLRDARTR